MHWAFLAVGNPNIHLTCHQRGPAGLAVPNLPLSYRANCPTGCALPERPVETCPRQAALRTGETAAVSALSDLGLKTRAGKTPSAEDEPANITPFWHVEHKRPRLESTNRMT